MMKELDINSVENVVGSETRYEVSYKVDSVDLPNFSSLLNMIWQIKKYIIEIETYGNVLGKLNFPSLKDINGYKFGIISDSNIDNYYRKTHYLKCATGANGSPSALSILYNNIYKSINKLFNLQNNITDFEFDYVGFYCNMQEAYGEDQLPNNESQFEILAYNEVSIMLDNLSGVYIENPDGSRTYTCTNGGTITFLNGEIVKVQNPNRELYGKNSDPFFIIDDKHDAVTYFLGGKPYATEYLDIHTLVNFSDRYNITYAWVPGDAYEYTPSFREGSINTNISYTYSGKGVNYSGEYLHFRIDKIDINVPLANFKYDYDNKLTILGYDLTSGSIVREPLTGIDRIIYIDATTRYINDAMHLFESKSNVFYDEITTRLDSITLIYLDESILEEEVFRDGDAEAYCIERSGTNTANIVFWVNRFLDLDNYNTFDYVYAVESMIHEMGHAFGNNKDGFDSDRDDSNKWRRIYEQVTADPAYMEILGDYAYTAYYELFAESVNYYYTDPDKLKMVSIDITIRLNPAESIEFDNLYDYMDYIMNNG